MAKDNANKISALLHEAAETHHLVYRITDGDDPDWASSDSPCKISRREEAGRRMKAYWAKRKDEAKKGEGLARDES